MRLLLGESASPEGIWRLLPGAMEPEALPSWLGSLSLQQSLVTRVGVAEEAVLAGGVAPLAPRLAAGDEGVGIHHLVATDGGDPPGKQGIWQKARARAQHSDLPGVGRVVEDGVDGVVEKQCAGAQDLATATQGGGIQGDLEALPLLLELGLELHNREVDSHGAELGHQGREEPHHAHRSRAVSWKEAMELVAELVGISRALMACCPMALAAASPRTRCTGSERSKRWARAMGSAPTQSPGSSRSRSRGRVSSSSTYERPTLPSARTTAPNSPLLSETSLTSGSQIRRIRGISRCSWRFSAMAR